MSLLKISDFDELVPNKKISPVYLFIGEEFYLLDLCVKKIRKIICVDDLNIEFFYISESRVDEILNSLKTIPILNNKKIVVVKEVNKINDIDIEKFINYLSNAVEMSYLILLYSYNFKKETSEKRKKFVYKCVDSKNCISIDCGRPCIDEVKKIVKSEVSLRGKNIADDAIVKIINNCVDLLGISNEIEKLSLFVGKNKNYITKNDLDKISECYKKENMYNLSKNIELLNLKKSIFILENLINDKEEPLVILSVISSLIRRILYAKCIMKKQVSETYLNKFYENSFFENVSKHKTYILKKVLKMILNAHILIKTGRCDAAITLENIVLYICHNTNQ